MGFHFFFFNVTQSLSSFGINVINLLFCDIERRLSIGSVLLFIDFEKVFDTPEWTFLEKIPENYKFGNSLISWIKLFYSTLAVAYKTMARLQISSI